MKPDRPQARALAPLIVRSLEQLGGQAPRGELIETALQLGGFTAAQRAVPSRHTRANAQQPSELHHRLGWAISHAKNAGEIESVRLGVWRRILTSVQGADGYWLNTYGVDAVRGGARLIARGVMPTAFSRDGRSIIGQNGDVSTTGFRYAQIVRVPWNGGKRRVLLRRAMFASFSG